MHNNGRILLAFAGLSLLVFPSLAGEYEEMHACDEYAAHPNDPNRWAKGVEDAEIIPGPAIKFCNEAVAAEEETPRFRFQLGRALWAARKFEQGLQEFQVLEEQYEYGPVYAYLADAYMYGIGGIEIDEELAISLYQIADEDGFTPAGEVLAALAGYQESPPNFAASATTQREQDSAQVQTNLQAPAPPQEPAFDPNEFSQPKVLRALYSGDIKGLRESGLGQINLMGITADRTLVYLNAFNSEFSGTYNFKDQTCIQIYEPALAKRMELDLTEGMMGGSMTTEGAAMTGLNMMLGMMQQFESPSGMRGMVVDSQSVEVLKESAAKDAAKLILGYSCQSPIVQRIYKNMAAYVYGRSGIASPEEQQRIAQQKVESEKRAEQNRQRQLRVSAKTSCVSQFKKEAYCGCLVDGLDAEGVTEADWKSLSTSFKNVISIGKNYEGFADKFKSCRSKS